MSETDTIPRSRGSSWPWRRLLAWTAALTVLSGVFLAYLNPHLAVDLANRLWACF